MDFIKYYLIVFLSLTVVPISVEAQRIPEGVFEGVIACDGGYRVDIRNRIKREVFAINVSRQGSTYFAQVSYNFEKSEEFAAARSRIRTSRSRVFDGFEFSSNGRKYYFEIIEGPSAFYLTMFIRNSKDGCDRAVLLNSKISFHPLIERHHTFCRLLLRNFKRSQTGTRQIESLISKQSYISYYSDIATEHMIWGHPLTHITQPEEEHDTLAYRIQDCMRISKNPLEIFNEVRHLFHPQVMSSMERKVAKWQNSRDMSALNYERVLRSFTVQALATRASKAAAHNSSTERVFVKYVNDLFLVPESPELETAMRGLSEFSHTLSRMEPSAAERVLKLIIARDEMLRASRALAKRFQLSEYPKLPPPNQETEARLIDDTLLRPLSDEEVHELEQNVEQDF